jgi:hypothetical protein
MCKTELSFSIPSKVQCGKQKREFHPGQTAINDVSEGFWNGFHMNKIS